MEALVIIASAILTRFFSPPDTPRTYMLPAFVSRVCSIQNNFTTLFRKLVAYSSALSPSYPFPLLYTIEADSRDRDGQTPLLQAAANGYEGVVQALLATGKVEVDSKDGDGGTPLSWAAADGHEGVVKLLREYVQLNKYC